MATQTPDSDRPTTGKPQEREYYWERHRRTAVPLVVGALGLVALGVGQLVGVRHGAETDLRSRSLAALTGAGFTGVTVDFTGQDGVLTGTVSSSADAQRALDIVRGLEGVRVATSRLTVPGTATGGTAPPSPSAEQPPAPTGTDLTSPSSSALPRPTPTGTPVTAPATPSTPDSGPAERAALQARLRTLPPIGFAYSSSQLTPQSRASLMRAAAVLETASPSRTFRIDGYTDDVGDWDRNLALSRARAEAVRQVLVANGVPAARVTAVGWSEEHPKVPNTSAANRAINRRVEIVVR